MASTKSDLLYAGGLILWEIVLLAVVFGLAADGILWLYCAVLCLVCNGSVFRCSNGLCVW